MLVSATDLSSYLWCPRKLYLSKVLKIREPVKDVMVRGTVMHETFDLAAAKEEALTQELSSSMTKEQFFDRFKSEYTQLLRSAIIKNQKNINFTGLIPGDLFVDLWPFVLSEAEARSSHIHKTASESSLYGVDLWEKLEPKILSELRIESEILHLKGIVDRIDVYTDKYVPVELKTGRTPLEGVWPSHKIQVGVYAMLVAEKFNTTVTESLVRYLDSNQSRPVVMNSFLEMEIKELVQKVIALFESSDIPVCAEKNKACEKMFPPESISK